MGNTSLKILNEIDNADEEYSKWLENEKALAEDYKKRLYGNVNDDVIAAFNHIKTAINTGENKVEVDGFYFPQEAIDLLNGADKAGYNLNSYMDLTLSDILNMIDDNNTPQDAIDQLFDDYKADSALCWGDNFIEVLKKTGIKAKKKVTESLDYEGIEANVMTAVWKALSGIDGTKEIEVLSGAPMGSNNTDSKMSVKFNYDGDTYVVNIMKIDGDLE